jgi:hypothetical protein
VPDNVGYTPGSGATVASDDIGGVQFQRVKLIHGDDGVNAGDVSVLNPYPTQAPRTDDLLEVLQRMVKLMESLAIVDVAQRQRISLDTIASGLTLGTVSTVTTVSTVSTVSNTTANAGMDREQYINIAKQTYGTSIRPHLSFV